MHVNQSSENIRLVRRNIVVAFAMRQRQHKKTFQSEKEWKITLTIFDDVPRF